MTLTSNIVVIAMGLILSITIVLYVVQQAHGQEPDPDLSILFAPRIECDVVFKDGLEATVPLILYKGLPTCEEWKAGAKTVTSAEYLDNLERVEQEEDNAEAKEPSSSSLPTVSHYEQKECIESTNTFDDYEACIRDKANYVENRERDCVKYADNYGGYDACTKGHPYVDSGIGLD